MANDFSHLKREIHPIPDDVLKALNENGLINAYCQRPAYQQNDYIGWIEHAKRQETRNKRVQQMLEELKIGGVYMKMKHSASIK